MCIKNLAYTNKMNLYNDICEKSDLELLTLQNIINMKSCLNLQFMYNGLLNQQHFFLIVIK